MNSKQIIKLIKETAGESVPSLAKKEGKTKQAFYDVIKQRTKTASIRNLISTITETPVDILWPEDKEQSA